MNVGQLHTLKVGETATAVVERACRSGRFAGVHRGTDDVAQDSESGRTVFLWCWADPGPPWRYDTVFFCRSDFHPFVYDKKTKTTVNVVPVAPRFSGDGRLRVIGVHSPELAHPKVNKLAKKHAAAERSGQAVVLAPNDPIAQKAFRDQQ